MFSVQLVRVLEDYGEEVLSGLSGAVTTLPTYVAVVDAKILEDPFDGCTVTPQLANTDDTWTYDATSIGESCAVECADGYEWPVTEDLVCLTGTSYWYVPADCVAVGDETSSYCVAELSLLITPLSLSGFTAHWVFDNLIFVRRAFASLLAWTLI